MEKICALCLTVIDVSGVDPNNEGSSTYGVCDTCAATLTSDEIKHLIEFSKSLLRGNTTIREMV